MGVYNTKAFVRVAGVNSEVTKDLKSLGASTAEPSSLPPPFDNLPSHDSYEYTGERVIVVTTVPVVKGQPIKIEAGIRSLLKSWGNATVSIDLTGSRVESVQITPKAP